MGFCTFNVLLFLFGNDQYRPIEYALLSCSFGNARLKHCDQIKLSGMVGSKYMSALVLLRHSLEWAVYVGSQVSAFLVVVCTMLVVVLKQASKRGINYIFILGSVREENQAL